MPDASPFLGREAFREVVRELLAEAAAEGWRELWLCDADFAHWPLGEPGVIDSLTRWAGAQRRLTVLALHYDELGRRHPRWVLWRRQWAHVVHCRALQELAADDVPSLLYAPDRACMRLFDPLRHRGSVSRLPPDILQAREQVDVISQRSVEAFPATTLGL